MYPPIPAGLSREKHVARLSLKSLAGESDETVVIDTGQDNKRMEWLAAESRSASGASHISPSTP